MINENIYENNVYLGMKLRLEASTIKLRLSKEEMSQLEREKSIVEQVNINGNNKFEYSVWIDKDENSCLAQFGDFELKVRIPLEKAEKWLQSSQVGLRETITADENEKLILVVEEDLPPRQKKN